MCDGYGVKQGKAYSMNDDDEIIVGFLIQREAGEDEFSFWSPENSWVEDPNEAMLYEDEDVAEAKAEELQAAETDAEVSVVVVIEDDEEDDEDEEEA